MNTAYPYWLPACTAPLLVFLALSELTAAELPTEEDVLADIPLVSSVTRLAQRPEDTPASVTVIDREMIRASGAINLPDLFRLVPGFQVGHVSGNQFAVTSHGVANNFPRRLLVMIDGRSVYTPVFSSVDWINLPVEIEDIDRIEVIRGPNVTSYGANAFKGAVNIITRQPFQDQGTYLKGTGGSQDTGIGMFRYGGKAGDFEYRVSASYREDSGFDDPAISDDAEVGKLTFRGNYQLNPRDQLDMQLGTASGDYGVAEIDDPLDPARDREVTTSYGSLRWNRALSSAESFYVQFYYNYLDMEDTFQIGPLSGVFGLTPEDFEAAFGQPDQTISHGFYNTHTERFDLEFQHTLQPRDDLRIAWGGSLRYDTIGGRYWFRQDEDDLVKRLFINAEGQLTKRLVLNAGAMVEDGDIVDTQFSPRLGLNYHIIPNHTVRASVARAYRIPSLFEEHEFNAYRFNDGDLLLGFRFSNGLDDPEEVTSYELGYVGYWPQQALTLDVKLYREEVDDIIGVVKDRRDTEFDPFDLISPFGFSHFVTTADVGALDINGIELALTYRPGPATFLTLHYAYADPSGVFVSENTLDVGLVGACPQFPDAEGFTEKCKDFRDYVPTHTYGLLAGYAFDSGWEASLGVYGVSPMTWLGDGDALPGYTRVDGRIARNFKLGESKGDIALVMQNLGGDYEEFREDNVFETRAYVQLSLSLP
jgi:iron complex outermembrane receptor protein